MPPKPYKKRTDAEQWNIDRPRIHALKNKVMAVQPGYTDDNYRDLISDISHGRADSSKDLSPRERLDLMDRLSILAGEEPRKPWEPRDKKSYPRRPRNIDRGDRAAQLQKIEALLTIGKLPWSYADAIAKQMRLADKVEWVDVGDLYKIISALVYKARREGWDLEEGGWKK